MSKKEHSPIDQDSKKSKILDMQKIVPSESRPEIRKSLEKPPTRDSLQEQPIENDTTPQPQSMDTSSSAVKGVYKWYARWYDLTRKVWNSFLAASAEKFFDKLLAEHIQNDAEILDVGVGTGLNIERVLGHKIKFATYEGVDLTPEMLAVAERKFSDIKNLTLRTGDITQMKISKKYDAIISTLVFSHLKEPDVVLQKLLTALKPKGKLLLLFFSSKSNPIWYDKVALWVYDHIFHFNPVSPETIDKFPASEIERKFPCLGAEVSVYVFQQNSHEGQS